MQKVFSAGSYIEAQLIRAYLEQSGISVRIINENSAGVPGTPHWALPVAAELWVYDDARREQAEQLITEYLARQTGAPRAEWICNGCQEVNPGSFEVCWNCGREAE